MAIPKGNKGTPAPRLHANGEVQVPKPKRKHFTSQGKVVPTKGKGKGKGSKHRKVLKKVTTNLRHRRKEENKVKRGM